MVLSAEDFTLVAVDDLVEQGVVVGGPEDGELWIAIYSSPDVSAMGGLFAVKWRSFNGCDDVDRLAKELNRSDIYHGKMTEIEDNLWLYCCTSCVASDLHSTEEHQG